MQYLPPFEALRDSIKTSPVDGELRVDMSYEDFVGIVRMLISGLHFDEAWYLSTYEDIAAAIRAGEVASAKQHFIGDGYFEGRRPFPMTVDERWYLAEYPDVAEGIRKGVLSSAQEHFDKDGYQEGRRPFDTERSGGDVTTATASPASPQPEMPRGPRTVPSRAGQRNGGQFSSMPH
jgi:hypothetical protein